MRAIPKSWESFTAMFSDGRLGNGKFPGSRRRTAIGGVLTASEGAKEPGINGGIVVRHGAPPKGGEPVNAFVCTIGVPNVDEYLQKIEKAGGSVAVPTMPIPGMAWLVYGKDVEGSIFGIFTEDKNAQ